MASPAATFGASSISSQIKFPFSSRGGDVVLKAVADLCKSTKRRPDVLARIGGEEFALLLPETDEASAEIVAERLRTTIQNAASVLPGQELTVTVSIGVASASLSMSSFAVMLKRADEALYEAKRTGRNRVVRAQPRLPEIFPLAAE